MQSWRTASRAKVETLFCDVQSELKAAEAAELVVKIYSDQTSRRVGKAQKVVIVSFVRESGAQNGRFTQVTGFFKWIA